MRFVVNCGLFQEREYDDWKSVLPFNAENIDFVFYTYAHVDYIGRLPYMTKINIYTRLYIKKKALIQFTGYTAEWTLGNKLKNTEVGDTVKVGGLFAKKRADVEYTTEYSTHAKADEMINFLKQFKNLKLVLVNQSRY